MEFDSRIAVLPSVVFTIIANSSFLIMSTMCGRPSRTLLARLQGNSGVGDRPRGAVGGGDLEAFLHQLPCEHHGAGLVALTHADEHHAAIAAT